MKALVDGTLGREQTAVAVIMAGGSGTRFWPLSRESSPKQFLRLNPKGESLIQATARRLEPIVGKNGVIVVTQERMVPLVREHLPYAVIIAEPIARNTAPCIALAAAWIERHVGDVPMICVPADHVIQAEDALTRVFQQAASFARKNPALLTVGIPPTYPETGFGYIERGAATAEQSEGTARSQNVPLFAVRRFVEKPDRATAEQYLASGDFFWNSGMFIWRPSVILDALRSALPEIHRGIIEIAGLFAKGAAGVSRIEQIFRSFPSVSIDFGVMEHAKNVYMLPGGGFSWSDVGSWLAWVDCLREGQDSRGNLGNEANVFVDSTGCAVIGEGRFVACVGLKDIIVVDTGDALLVCQKDAAQEVKKVVEELKSKGRVSLL